MNELFIFSVASLSGIIASRITKKFGLPSVTGYLLAGLIIGPSVLKIIPRHHLKELSYICELALGFIAFHIGESFELKTIKKLAKDVITITFVQALTTVLLVLIVMYVITKDFSFSLLLAAVSAATAPAATLMVIKEYHSRGPLTDTLISVVAMDDVVCIFLFSISVAIVDVIASGTINLYTAILTPIIEIFGSMIIGVILGGIIVFFETKRTSKDMFIIIPLSLIVFGISLSQIFELSTLLTCVSIGAVVANASRVKHKIFDTVETFAVPIYMLFFIFSGMELNISILKQLGIIAIIYIIARSSGKMAGAYMGAIMTKADNKIKKYLGLGLLPQAGVAIGLAVIISERYPDSGLRISNIIMAAVLFYEIIGPILTKHILIKSKEAHIE